MSSIGKDLATIRHHKKLTVEDIHQRTRIPIQTIKRIEDGSIFSDPDQNKIYLRSFVRTYGRALNLNDERILKGLDQQESGNYNRLLLDDFPDIDRSRSPQPVDPSSGTSGTQQPADTDSPDSGTSEEEPPQEQESETPTSTGSPDKSPESSPGSSAHRSRPATDPATGLPDVPAEKARAVDWAEMGQRFTEARQGGSGGWIAGGLLILLVLAAAAWFLFQSDVFSDAFQADDLDLPEETTAEQADPEGHELSLDLSDGTANGETGADTDAAESAGTGEELADVLYLTVFAAHERLEPVRVWSDLKPRMDPYWLEQGQAYNFEFRDTIRVRTNYNRMLLFLNGHLIENARAEHFNESENAIELTRDYFEQQERWTTATELELPEDVAPPDSIPNRPLFE